MIDHWLAIAISTTLLAVVPASNAPQDPQPPSGIQLTTYGFPAAVHLVNQSMSSVIAGYVVIQNTGEESIRVPIDLRPYIQPVLQDPNGKYEQFKCLITEDLLGGAEKTIMLTPGGIYGVREDIGVPRPAGVYRLSFIFHSPNAKGVDRFITGAHQTPEIAIATEGPGAK